jgi:hypothetical protein
MISEVPAEVRDAARRAFASRDRAAQVLDLVGDTLLDPSPPAGARQLDFGTPPGPQVHVAVDDAGAGRVLLEISSQAPELTVLEVRCGDDIGELAASDGQHVHSGPIRHGLLTIVVTIGEKRFQTAALRV